MQGGGIHGKPKNGGNLIMMAISVKRVRTLEYRINGGGVGKIGGSWKWFDKIIIGGLEELGGWKWFHIIRLGARTIGRRRLNKLKIVIFLILS